MEQHSNLGYLAIYKETTPGTPAGTPDVFIPLYSETLATEASYVEDMPIMAQKFFRYQVLRGLRSHGGDLVLSGDTNTAAYVADMLYTKGSTSGSDPYTHPYTLSKTAQPKSYSIEIGLPTMAVRFLGYGASQVTPEFEDGHMRLNVSGSALKSFDVRKVASISGTGPYTITLTTEYSRRPTEGLVTGDAIQIYDVSTASYITATVEALTDTTIEVTEDVSAAAADDILSLQPQTPSWNVGDPFLWGDAQFCFGADAATALTADHTPLEQDSSLTLIHEFANNDAAHASGSFDPTRLLRGRGDVEFTAKQYFDSPEEMARFNAITKRACVIRYFADNGHELRVTLNNLKATTAPRPPLESQEVLYSETKYVPTLDATDGQGFDVKVINGLSTI